MHGELAKLGISISQAAVSKYMVRHRTPPSHTWRSFLDNHANDLVSLDFFTLPTASCPKTQTNSRSASNAPSSQRFKVGHACKANPLLLPRSLLVSISRRTALPLINVVAGWLAVHRPIVSVTVST